MQLHVILTYPFNILILQIPVVVDNVEEVASALEDFTDDIETITSDDMEDVADTLINIVAVESPSKEVSLVCNIIPLFTQTSVVT